MEFRILVNGAVRKGRKKRKGEYHTIPDLAIGVTLNINNPIY